MKYNSKFECAWRFTDEKYNKLPIEELEEINEITEEQSLNFWNTNILDNIKYFPISDIVANNEIIIRDCGWGDNETETVTSEKMKDIFKDFSKIKMFWGSRYAVEVNTDIFIKYWSDFCYCSDSGNVIFLNNKNIFIYHEDILLKARFV